MCYGCTLRNYCASASTTGCSPVNGPFVCVLWFARFGMQPRLLPPLAALLTPAAPAQARTGAELRLEAVTFFQSLLACANTREWPHFSYVYPRRVGARYQPQTPVGFLADPAAAALLRDTVMGTSSLTGLLSTVRLSPVARRQYKAYPAALPLDDGLAKLVALAAAATTATVATDDDKPVLLCFAPRHAIFWASRKTNNIFGWRVQAGSVEDGSPRAKRPRPAGSPAAWPEVVAALQRAGATDDDGTLLVWLPLAARLLAVAREAQAPLPAWAAAEGPLVAALLATLGSPVIVPAVAGWAFRVLGLAALNPVPASAVDWRAAALALLRGWQPRRWGDHFDAVGALAAIFLHRGLVVGAGPCHGVLLFYRARPS